MNPDHRRPNPRARQPRVSYKLSGVVLTEWLNGRRVLPRRSHWTSLKSFQSWKPRISRATPKAVTKRAEPLGKQTEGRGGVPGYDAVPRRGGSHRRYHARCVLSELQHYTRDIRNPASSGGRARGVRARRGTDARGARTDLEAIVVIDFGGGMGWAPSATTVTDAGAVHAVGASNIMGHYIFASKTGFALFYEPLNLARPSTAEMKLTRTR